MVSNPRCDIWKYFNNIIEEGVAVCKFCNQRLKNKRSFTLRKHIKKLHNPESDVWKYFDNVVDEGVAVCKLCKKRVKTNRHYNLIQHLRHHDIDVNECPVENVYVIMDEKIIVNAVMGLMVDENISPQLFGSKNMQALLGPVCDAVSQQNTIKFTVDEEQSEQVVHKVANIIRDKFENDLRHRLLSLKIDMAINSNINTFLVSVQFINGTRVESCTLGEINLRDEKYFTERSILNILYKFKMDSRQIVCASWDNSKAKFKKSVSNSEYLRQIQEFENYPDIKLEGVIKLERYSGAIVQLCVLDVLKNPIIFPLFKECRNLTKFINDNLHIFSKVFQEKGLGIPRLDSPWKWGSTYTMMNDLKESLDVLENIQYEQPENVKDRFNLNGNLNDFIKSFCKAFTYVQKSAQKFYTSEMIYGDFYAQWLKCKILTEKLYNDSEKGGNLAKISGELVESIVNRSAELLNQDHFKACLYLDPRFQHTLTMPEKMFALEYLKELWNRSKLYNSELVDPVSENIEENQQQLQSFDDDDDDTLLNDYLSQSAQKIETAGIYRKLEELKLPFQTADTNVLSYWKEIKFCEPEIYTLSTICFAIPATQNYNKITFSYKHPQGYTSNICSDLSESLELIRLNQHILDKDTIEKLQLFRENVSSGEFGDNQ